ncbi:MAG TPA: hypothetical protein VJ044_17680 [Candidatus Hodarchaeales archaeon]|nr:hypothetical protein [Candidatus Hodarchaeales archaeon]
MSRSIEDTSEQQSHTQSYGAWANGIAGTSHELLFSGRACDPAISTDVNLMHGSGSISGIHGKLDIVRDLAIQFR